MNPETITYVLTGLAAVVVVLTRIRLRGEGAGRLSISAGVRNLHTVAGVVGLGLWIAFLVTGQNALGYAGLAALWATVAAGLLILLRWLPAKGRHSSGPVSDEWGEGPGLSILGHIGMLVGVALFTAFLVLDQLS